MALTTIFVSGLCGCGKTTIARMLSGEALECRPHYVRLRSAVPTDPPGLHLTEDLEAAGMATCRSVRYLPERVFEALPDVLGQVRRLERFGTVVIEADAEPCLRHAYPYDHRIFVMSAPENVFEVFRPPDEAADALQQVMQDTAAFASEIFGLFDSGLLDDDKTAPTVTGVRTPRGIERRVELSEQHLLRFLAAPLGAEVACRVQLQPEYHALVECDIAVINAGLRSETPAVEACVKRLETLMSRIRTDARRHNILYRCNPTDRRDPIRQKLLDRLADLCPE